MHDLLFLFFLYYHYIYCLFFFFFGENIYCLEYSESGQQIELLRICLQIWKHHSDEKRIWLYNLVPITPLKDRTHSHVQYQTRESGWWARENAGTKRNVAYKWTQTHTQSLKVMDVITINNWSRGVVKVFVLFFKLSFLWFIFNYSNL